MGWFTGAIAWLLDPANWQGPNGVAVRLVEHLGLTAASLGLACAIALPVALWLGHVGRGGALAINVSNVGRAVPTFALLAIFTLGPPPLGRSTFSIVLALTLFAIPPIITNTYVGVRGVDREVVEAATGMGMSGSQVLRRVELPLAVPLLMNGVRIAAVQIVATATIAALVAGGGLGRIITSGFTRQDQDQVVAGALLVGLMALVVELAFEYLQGRLDPVRSGRDRSGPRPPGPREPARPGEAVAAAQP